MGSVRKRAPVLSFAEAADTVRKIREKGLTLVFTNGCFDILHPGHMEVLEKASRMGDVLAVGLNTDDSVKRLKGPARPVNSLEDRALVLSCIRFPDMVIPFSEDTPLELIRLLLPDVLVKGGDYTVDTIAGAETVISRGGKVEIIPLLEGHSTTGILERTEP